MPDFNAQITFSAEVGDVLRQLDSLSKASLDFGGASGEAQAQLQSAVGQTQETIKNLQGRLVELYAQRSRGDQTEALQQEIKLTEQAVQGLQGDLKRLQAVMPQVGHAGSEMGQTGASGLLQMAQAFGLAQLASQAFQWAVSEIRDGIRRFIESGIEFNRTLETARIGIGTLIATQNDLTDSQGHTLQGQQALSAGMALGEEQVKKLRLASFETVATFEQLVAAYQQGLGPMQQAGVTLDESVQLTQRFAQAAGALGLDINTLGHELRATFSGQISPRITRIASALHIRREDIETWKQAGTLVQNLNQRLEFFGLAGQQVEASWQGVTSNVQHFFESFSGETIQPMFEAIKTGLHDALHDAFDMSTGDFSSAFQGLIGVGKEIFGQLGTMAGDVLQKLIGWAKELSAWFQENQEPIHEFVVGVRVLVEQVGGLLADLVGYMASFTGQTNDATNALGALDIVVQGIGLTIAVIRDAVRILAAGLVSVVTVLVQGVAGPIQGILIAIARAMDFIKSGSGDAVENVAAQMQSLIDRGYQLTNSLVKPFQEGKNAVAQFGDALLDAQRKQESVGKAKPAGGEKVTAHPRLGAEDAKDLQKAAEVLNALQEQTNQLKLEDLRTAQALTLEEQKQKADAEAKAKLEEERRRIAAELKKSDTGENRAAARQASLAAEKLYQDTLQANQEKFDRERQAAEDRIGQELAVSQAEGLERQLAQLRAHFDKIREEIKKGSDTIHTEEQVQAAEDQAIQNAKAQALQRDVQAIRQRLQELAKEKGAPLTLAESFNALNQVAGRSPEALAQVRMELERTRDAWGGFQAGIQTFIAQSQNLFSSFQSMALGALQSIQGGLQSVIEKIMEGCLHGTQIIQALAKAMEMAIIGVLARMAAQYLVATAAQAIFHAGSTTASLVQQGAAEKLAAAETWAAYSDLPFVGQQLAIAQIAIMEGSIAGVGKITKAATGAFLDSPTLLLAGEAGPEVILPETNFLEYFRTTLGMGAAIGQAMETNQQAVASYNQLGAGYISSGAQARLQAPKGATSEVHNHYEGALIVSESLEGQRTFDQHVMASQQRIGEWNG